MVLVCPSSESGHATSSSSWSLSQMFASNRAHRPSPFPRYPRRAASPRRHLARVASADGDLRVGAGTWRFQTYRRLTKPLHAALPLDPSSIPFDRSRRHPEEHPAGVVRPCPPVRCPATALAHVPKRDSTGAPCLWTREADEARRIERAAATRASQRAGRPGLGSRDGTFQSVRRLVRGLRCGSRRSVERPCSSVPLSRQPNAPATQCPQ